MTLILSNDDVEKLLTVPDCIAALEEAYVELAEGRGITRTRSDCVTPTPYSEDATYGLKSMDGVVPKFGIGAIRINSDIITAPREGNTRRRVKVPAAPNDRYVGLVLLFRPQTANRSPSFRRCRTAHPGRIRQRPGGQVHVPQGRQGPGPARRRLAGGNPARRRLRGARHRGDPLLSPRRESRESFPPG